LLLGLQSLGSPPFLEAIASGYIIPLADDIQFTTDARGNLTFTC